MSDSTQVLNISTKAGLEAHVSDVANFATADGDVFTGVHDFGGATSLEIPNSATPTVDAAGEIAVDTTITDHTGLIAYHDGTEKLLVVAIPEANLSTTNGHVISYNASNNEFEMAAGGGGASALNDLSDVTYASGDLTIASLDTIITAGALTLDSGAAINIDPASGSAIVLDGVINIDAGVVTDATSITSVAFVGALTGNVTGNASGTAATVTTAAQPNITSLGTLTALTVDDVVIDGKVVTMTGSAGDTAVFTVGTNGTLSIVTTDTAAAAANLQITADGTVDIDSVGILTLDSGAAINIEPATGSAILLDDTISIDAGVVTGATSITSAAFVGALTGNVTGNVTGNAGTATALATGRLIGMTGDVVWTSASFTGAGNVTGSATIQPNAVDGTMIEIGTPATGDIIYYGGTDYVRLVKGTDDQVLTLASGVPSWAAAGGAAAGLPLGYIGGFGISHATDTAHDIIIAPGEARDDANGEDIILSAAITKQIDATWAVGTNQGGLDTGAVVAHTSYAIWAIKRTDTGVVDILFSVSFTAPEMPANYDVKVFIKKFVATDGDSDIRKFRNFGNYVSFEDIWADISDSSIDHNLFEEKTSQLPPNSLATWQIGLDYTGIDTRIGVILRQTASSLAASSSLYAPYLDMSAAVTQRHASERSLLLDSSRKLDVACFEVDGISVYYLYAIGCLIP